MQLTELLESEGIADRSVLSRATRRAADHRLPLVLVLVESEGAAEDQIADALARALGTVVIDVAGGTLDSDAVMMVPEHVARQFLLVAVAPNPSNHSIQVAFANPLDQEAVEAVRQATGLEVEPLVATVGGLQAAIEHEYGKRGTQIIKEAPKKPGTQARAVGTATGGERTDEIPMDPGTQTHIVRPRTGPGRTSTVPLHRLEQDATAEQRHEALLLALIDAGAITRADYVRALRRLLGHEEP